MDTALYIEELTGHRSKLVRLARSIEDIPYRPSEVCIKFQPVVVTAKKARANKLINIKSDIIQIR